MPTVAEQLRSAREAHGWSVHQVAEITKIKTEHVRALESGDYRAFAAAVYIRGFLRTYARLLRLPPEDLMTALDAELNETGVFAEHSLNAPRHGGVVDTLMLAFSKVNWRVALPLVIIALLLVGLIVGSRLYAHYRDRDHLLRLSPGLHQPARPHPEEFLPLPPTHGTTQQREAVADATRQGGARDAD
jgi:cytoskeletal protein RodZ